MLAGQPGASGQQISVYDDAAPEGVVSHPDEHIVPGHGRVSTLVQAQRQIRDYLVALRTYMSRTDPESSETARMSGGNGETHAHLPMIASRLNCRVTNNRPAHSRPCSGIEANRATGQRHRRATRPISADRPL